MVLKCLLVPHEPEPTQKLLLCLQYSLRQGGRKQNNPEGEQFRGWRKICDQQKRSSPSSCPWTELTTDINVWIFPGSCTWQGGPQLYNFLRSTPGQVHKMDHPPAPQEPIQRRLHTILSAKQFSRCWDIFCLQRANTCFSNVPLNTQKWEKLTRSQAFPTKDNSYF